MDPLLTLKIIELRHEQLRADADRARRVHRAVRARQAPRHRSVIDWVRIVAGRRRSSRRTSVQPAR